MKKITLLAFACALTGLSMAAQEAQEIQYVEDPSQGLLINSFKSNWFITAQGGINAYFSHKDVVRDFGDRLAPNAAIYVGKWFTPVWGARIGVDWLWLHGMTTPTNGTGAVNDFNAHPDRGLVKQRLSDIGPAFDLMANLTNLFCGYKPDRKYNFIMYGGAGGYWTMVHNLKDNGEAKDSWRNAHDRVLTFRAGIINSFNVSKQLAVQLDLRASAIDGVQDGYNYAAENRTFLSVQAYLGLTYNFAPRGWHAPVVPVCPAAENCDALRARLQAADARIADLENQLRDCLNKPAAVVTEKAPLATIYYPINVSRLTREDKNVLGAVANVMKDNANTNYVLTGWADNYTGTDAINKRLRRARVDGVYNYLTKNEGVNASQLEATTNDGNLCDLGEKYVALDRAVTIEEK